ncbi:YfiT family bacillithiol transferase [Brevibacillus sp. SYSU BS000544]|uniref:YfiT family bacillithiol transferase n=1 Tax=Brevibacillus sp. SYSU BS000544 TaxID=3416443 RepID=UPI003CE54697
MDLRYPIGTFEWAGEASAEQMSKWIDEIEAIPTQLRLAVKGLSPEQLDTPYRPDGWTLRQVVHHVADSHMNSYIRFKLALTEDEPTIKPYEEASWAELADSAQPVEVSLTLLDALHERWIVLLRSMSPEDFKRSFIHPQNGVVSLTHATGLYSWHGRHHIAHVTTLRERMGW